MGLVCMNTTSHMYTAVMTKRLESAIPSINYSMGNGFEEVLREVEQHVQGLHCIDTPS